MADNVLPTDVNGGKIVKKRRAKKAEPEPSNPMPYDVNLLNVIRGKSMMMSQDVGVKTLARMIDWFVEKLDESDEDDTFGTEGWRRHFGASE